jgi:hypothetical protein
VRRDSGNRMENLHPAAIIPQIGEVCEMTSTLTSAPPTCRVDPPA